MNFWKLFSFILFHFSLWQEQAFNELEKNSDKQQRVESLEDGAPPAHLHELLASLHKHLLAHCHVNAHDEFSVSEPYP